MELLDELEIVSHAGTHKIELYHGDLTAIPDEQAVDLLVVSAFPNNYRPVNRSLIGALHKKGIRVDELSRDKAEDLRESFSCWMSKPIEDKADSINFDRILVFEPRMKGSPADVVGDVFQSLIPFVHGEPHIRSLAMPVVGTGRQRFSGIEVLQSLLDAAVNWFLLGLPVETIRIVEHQQLKAMELKGAFGILKQQYANLAEPEPQSAYKYDYFISYSHENTREVDAIHHELMKLNPDLRIFIDHKMLNAGAAWQTQLYETIDECKRVIVVYSPTYLTSKVCKEEYNIALMRHREEGDVLVPIYLYSANLPTYMRLIQFIDCRENNREKILDACREMTGHKH